MAQQFRILRWVLALAIALGLTACNEGTPKSKAQSISLAATCGNTGAGSDSFTLGGTTYVEAVNGPAAVSDLPTLCEPLVDAFVSGDFFVHFWRGMSGTSASTVIQQEYDIDIVGGVSGTYDLATAAAFVDYFSASGQDCTANAGTITVTVGANLTTATGSFSVTTWSDFAALGCPAPALSGSFNVVRNDFNLF